MGNLAVLEARLEELEARKEIVESEIKRLKESEKYIVIRVATPNNNVVGTQNPKAVTIHDVFAQRGRANFRIFNGMAEVDKFIKQEVNAYYTNTVLKVEPNGTMTIVEQRRKD